jgi:hypothetical protein
MNKGSLGSVLGAAVLFACGGGAAKSVAGDDGTADAGNASVSFQNVGSITAGWGYDLAPVQSAAAGFAVFGASPSEPGLERSTWSCRAQRDVGACHVSTCGVVPSASSTPSAGTITIGDAALSFPLAWTPLFADFEGGWVDGGAPWPAGSVLTVKASGGDVPAFETTTTVPTDLVLTTPDPTSSSITINRAAGFALAWKVDDGDVIGELSGTSNDADAGSSSLLLACRFPRSAGGATIPPDALSDFAPQAALVRIWSSTTATVTAGAYSVDVSSNGAGVTGVASLE